MWPISEPEWQAISNFLILIGIIMTGLQSWRNGRAAKKLEEKTDANKIAIHEVHTSVNGTLAKFVADTKIASDQTLADSIMHARAQGKAEGRAEGASR